MSSAVPAWVIAPVLDDVDHVGEEKGLGRVVGDQDPRSGEAIEVLGEDPTQLDPGGDVEGG